MKKTIMYLTLVAMFASAPLFSSAALANTTDKQIDEIVTILKDNPEIVATLHESLNGYVAQQAQFSKALVELDSYINSPVHPVSGSDEPALTIVNVTDYNCPYCKRLEPELEKLVANYPQIKVVNFFTPLKELMQQSDSNTAAYALKVWQDTPEKYKEVHDLLVAKRSMHDDASLKAVAEKTQTVKQLEESGSMMDVVDKNYRLFTELGLRGTPAMIMGDQVVPGYLPYDKLEQIVQQQL